MTPLWIVPYLAANGSARWPEAFPSPTLQPLLMPPKPRGPAASSLDPHADSGIRFLKRVGGKLLTMDGLVRLRACLVWAPAGC